MTRKYDESNNASLVLPRLGAIITKILMETKQKKCERKQHYCVSSSQSVTVEGVTRLMFEFCVSPRYRGGGETRPDPQAAGSIWQRGLPTCAKRSPWSRVSRRSHPEGQLKAKRMGYYQKLKPKMLKAVSTSALHSPKAPKPNSRTGRSDTRHPSNAPVDPAGVPFQSLSHLTELTAARRYSAGTCLARWSAGGTWKSLRVPKSQGLFECVL